MAQPCAQPDVSSRNMEKTKNRTLLIRVRILMSHQDVRGRSSGLTESDEEENQRQHERRKRHENQIHLFEFQMHEDRGDQKNLRERNSHQQQRLQTFRHWCVAKAQRQKRHDQEPAPRYRILSIMNFTRNFVTVISHSLLLTGAAYSK